MIGAGSFGKVVLGRKNGGLYAVKIIENSGNDEYLSSFQNEQKIHKNVSNQFIARVYDNF